MATVSRSKTVPAGPMMGNKPRANAAPNCTDNTDASTTSGAGILFSIANPWLDCIFSSDSLPILCEIFAKHEQIKKQRIIKYSGLL
jgi:hypothetical protein